MGERSLAALDVPWARSAPARVQRAPGNERHPIEIRFAAPIQPRGVEHSGEVMEHVRAFFEQAGADITPAERTPQLAGATAP